jgi:hypothetical protein
MKLQDLRKTKRAKWLIIPRLVAALPLVVFGSFHLTGMSPLLEILRRADIPFPDINFFVCDAGCGLQQTGH